MSSAAAADILIVNLALEVDIFIACQMAVVMFVPVQI
jgi:hypothetical protein